jgi:hypothetical protein
MTKFTDQELLLLNQRGLIPGPSESENDFEKRAEYCLNLKNNFKELLGNEIPEEVDLQLSLPLVEEAAPTTKKLFDICPDWVPVIFSNFKMLPWHGGSAWIFQLTEDSPTAAFFQLRKAFISSKKFLGIYDREELITHESAHIGRMLFNEPKFEELLAYRTSNSSFRRWLGPIVQSSWESLLFVFILILCFFSDLAILLSGYEDPNHSTLWIKLIPVILFTIGLGRLSLRHWQFNHCLKKLQKILGIEKANAVIYRLQDLEIINFSKMSSEQIKQFFDTSENASLRWKVIRKAYFN